MIIYPLPILIMIVISMGYQGLCTKLCTQQTHMPNMKMSFDSINNADTKVK
jgi:hypothetical protein